MESQADIRDESGNPIQLTDELGNPVKLTDEHGRPVRLTGIATSADAPGLPVKHLQEEDAPPVKGIETAALCESVAATDAGDDRGLDEPKHEEAVPKLQEPGQGRREEERSSSSSSSSSEDDGQGGRRKKGLKQKIKEKLGGGGGGGGEKQKEHQGGSAATITATHSVEVQHHEQEHKKGMLEKIKEKLPGHHSHH